VFSTIHSSAQGAAMNRWCRCLEYLGEFAEVSQCMSFLVCSAVHQSIEGLEYQKWTRKHHELDSQVEQWGQVNSELGKLSSTLNEKTFCKRLIGSMNVAMEHCGWQY
jgi:chaperone required for assembly of F1-ATPase